MAQKKKKAGKNMHTVVKNGRMSFKRFPAKASK